LSTLIGGDKYLSAARQEQQSSKSLTRAERLIERANQVDLFDVLEDYFALYLPRVGASYKSHCPFSYEHPDGGLDKGWRTYPSTNSSMCFVLHGYMPPVRLVAIKYGIKQSVAAERILKNYDLLRPAHYRDRYNELVTAAEQRNAEVIGNPQHAVEALNMVLRSSPNYTTRQFDSDVMRGMEVVLDALDQVIQSGDPDSVRRWFDKAKDAMLKIVGGV
jgi:hypothetical protein